jgi:hypothetical protein
VRGDSWRWQDLVGKTRDRIDDGIYEFMAWLNLQT